MEKCIVCKKYHSTRIMECRRDRELIWKNYMKVNPVYFMQMYRKEPTDENIDDAWENIKTLIKKGEDYL